MLLFIRAINIDIKFYLTCSMCRSGAARSSSAAMASSASLDVLLNVGSVRSRPRGVKVPDRLVHSFNSDISRANLRPPDCHSVMRLSYSYGKSKYQSWRSADAYLLPDGVLAIQRNVLHRQPVSRRNANDVKVDMSNMAIARFNEP